MPVKNVKVTAEASKSTTINIYGHLLKQRYFLDAVFFDGHSGLSGIFLRDKKDSRLSDPETIQDGIARRRFAALKRHSLVFFV